MNLFDTRNKAPVLNFVSSGLIFYMNIPLSRQKIAALRETIIGSNIRACVRYFSFFHQMTAVK